VEVINTNTKTKNIIQADNLSKHNHVKLIKKKDFIELTTVFKIPSGAEEIYQQNVILKMMKTEFIKKIIIKE